MAYIKEIQEEVKSVTSLKELTEVYGEIASTRMRKIRGFVLKNREFLNSISSIFRNTLSAYEHKISDLISSGKMKESEKITFLAHNGKTVLVLLSANTGFFGEVVKETFRKFMADVRNQDVEVTIIGKIGRSLFITEEPKKPYVFFDLPDFGIDNQKLSEVIRHLVQYEEIKVYYGKFETLITQKPDIAVISAGTKLVGGADEPKYSFLFEPSLEQILMFFETQIFASLFDQSLRESQLAKFASRILAMDRASQNIKQKIQRLNLERLTVAHKIQNVKQLNSLSSIVYSK